ncbi:hypothetical protein CHELA20_53634 [Hyphomicrobiales bacterium]|nr:hypothetical protein CHELA41_21294 [Hyphomicrobiales bacterium]CAH1684642.1 hypothetical protein CHELA20_53634 [Hyphomicrobiales bacterium]
MTSRIAQLAVIDAHPCLSLAEHDKALARNSKTFRCAFDTAIPELNLPSSPFLSPVSACRRCSSSPR